jgi:hypothetical protein
MKLIKHHTKPEIKMQVTGVGQSSITVLYKRSCETSEIPDKGGTLDLLMRKHQTSQV